MKSELNAVTWDLEALYASAELWENDLKRLKKAIRRFAAFRGRLSEGPEILRQAIEASDECDRLEEKLYSYAHLRSDEDTTVSKNRARVDRASARFAELSAEEAWFIPEIMALPDKVMKRYLASPELRFYRHSLEELLREKPHVLSEPEERLIGVLSDVLGSSDETFSTLNDTDLRFGKVKDDTGKLRELTHGNYLNFLESGDRKVRCAAFQRTYNTYAKWKNTFAVTLDSTIKRHVASAKIRHYDSALAAALSDNNVPESLYLKLIETVHSRLEILFDYFDLRRETLQLEKLDMYDLFAPLVPDCRKEYTFDQASEIVRQALKPLGEEYGNFLKRAWSERWIDAPERRGKRSGAYSGGCYDSYPYVLLNFQGSLNDVFTLAHELGHSMHSFYSRRAQKYHYADYKIFVAEVASTTNEILLFHHLLSRTDDPGFRAYLYSQLADEIRATVCRQTMFAEFELGIHRASWEGTPLTADFLCENYYKLNAEYHGPHMDPAPGIAMEWARIPHFYYDFYVYQYATGMSAAIQLAKGILSGDTQKREAYLGFLKAGDSKDVLEILLDAGVDLTTAAPVEAAMETLKESVQNLRKELKKAAR